MNKEAALRTKPSVSFTFSPHFEAVRIKTILWASSSFFFPVTFSNITPMQENIPSLINTALWIFYKTRSPLFETAAGSLEVHVSVFALISDEEKSRRCDFGWFGLWWITDVHFNLFTSFWSSPLSTPVALKITGKWLTDQDCWGKNDCLVLIYLFISTRRHAKEEVEILNCSKWISDET